MAKRYTESEKWKSRWFQELHPKMKLFWLYILDQCDHAGIWDVNVELASFQLGGKVTEKELLEVFADKIEVIDDGSRWFIPKFIVYQYGELSESNRVHSSVRRKLEKYNCIKPLARPLLGSLAKENDVKEKDKDKDSLSIIKKRLIKRLESFTDDVYTHSDKHSKNTLKAFVDYWTETNKSKTKMRFEMEKTWDTGKRLGRWSSNNKDEIESGPKPEEQFENVCPNGHYKRKMAKGVFAVCPTCKARLIPKVASEIQKYMHLDPPES
tara:strand:+ start:199 stop:999 length:801 start_codon:yes stop_codon:yes gene_type:complete